MSKSRVTDKTDGLGCDMQETKISLFHRNSVKHHLWTRGASQLPLEWGFTVPRQIWRPRCDMQQNFLLLEIKQFTYTSSAS